MNEQLVDRMVCHTFSFPCLTGEAKQEECDPRGSTRDGNAVEVVADTESVDFGSCAVTGDSSCIEDPSDADSFMFTLAV